MALAYAVAAVHAAAVVVLLIGALLTVRWPRVLLVHLPVAVGILAVNRAGADCPLTTFELWLRARAGREGYHGGFLHHYAFEPVGIDIASAPALIGVYAAAVLPTVIGYSLLVARALRRRREVHDELGVCGAGSSSSRQRRSCEPRLSSP